MTAQAYAGWRFGKGKRSAGWRDLDGLVLIDGSMDGTHWADVLLPQHFEREDELAQGIYYWQRPEAGYLLGYLAEIGGMAATFGAELESFLWSSLEGTPLQWPDPATCPTNKAVFAALTDDEYGFSGTFMSHQGELLAPVDLDQDGEDDTCAGGSSDRLLAHWSDFDETGEFSSTDRWARLTFEGTAPNFAEWYFPIALNSEMDLAHNLDSKAAYLDESTQAETTAADSFGHRIFDTARVKLPAFGFVTANCMDPYEWYGSVATSLTDYTLVDRSQEHCGEDAGEDWAHLDPLLAEDEGGHTNDFVRTLARWLEAEVL
jgi:hypothetical protein